MLTKLIAAFMLLSTAVLTPAYAQTVPQIVSEVAQAHGVSPRLALAVAGQESNFRCNARGSAGERGVMQVKPATARSVGVTGNLYDCRIGATAGVRYLKLALQKAGGNVAVAVSLYNKGIYGSKTVNGYGRKLMRSYNAGK